MNIPIVLYTNLFTLENKPVNDNKYIDMYYIWLNNVLKYARLNDDDHCITFIDNVTFNYIKTRPIFNFFINNIKQLKIIVYNQPKHIKEGMLQRYSIGELLKLTNIFDDYNPFYLYLDIDVLVMNDIHKLISIEPNMGKTTFFLRTEQNDFLSGLYYGELVQEDDRTLIQSKNVNLPGFSSGIFGWINSITIREYFNYIQNMAIKSDKDYYTVDQPFFCAAIFKYLIKDPGIFNFVIFNKNNILENIQLTNQEKNSDIILVNYCGIPGDDKFHWDKLLFQLLLQNL